MASNRIYVKLDSLRTLTNMETMNRDLVDWTGPTDTKNPRDWPKWQRRCSMAILALLGFTISMASTIVTPAVGVIATDFNVSTDSLFWIDSSFHLRSALGAFIWPSLSEAYGRMGACRWGNILFLFSTFFCTLSRTPSQLMTVRALSGFVGAASLTIPGGIVADLYPPGDRSLPACALAFWSLLGSQDHVLTTKDIWNGDGSSLGDAQRLEMQFLGCFNGHTPLARKQPKDNTRVQGRTASAR
ncbi:MFS general substrate transporter [Aspergillus ellipticus CBS 707.79]|uniref:MFS general substrate transporter n=1 Tax=Aspergillus ellipticus CBS 707.79 TaxID=1448320 RepID=A0A319DGG8_9EURO|nr:MFS general substrate transporter [Aspergillus ellipticus CBS 707.79]